MYASRPHATVPSRTPRSTVHGRRQELTFTSSRERFAVLGNIFGFLNEPKDLAACSLVCRLWNPVAISGDAWLPLARMLGCRSAALGSDPRVDVKLRLTGRDYTATTSNKPRVTMAGFTNAARPSGRGEVARSPPRADRFASIIYGRTGGAAVATEATERSIGSHGTRVVLPRRSVREELDTIARVVTSGVAATRPLIEADRMDVVHRQAQALAARATGHEPQWKSLKLHVDRLHQQSEQLLRDATATVASRASSEHSVAVIDRKARALLVRKRRLDFFKDFERLCCINLLVGGGAEPAKKAPTAASSDDDLLQTILRANSAPQKVPATCLETFAQLEMLCSNPRYMGTPVYARWALLKRALPVSEAFYDLRDCLADPSSFDVDEYALGLADFRLETESEAALAPRDDLRTVLNELVRRRWPDGEPSITSILLDKMQRVLRAAEKGDPWDVATLLC